MLESGLDVTRQLQDLKLVLTELSSSKISLSLSLATHPRIGHRFCCMKQFGGTPKVVVEDLDLVATITNFCATLHGLFCIFRPKLIKISSPLPCEEETHCLIEFLCKRLKENEVGECELWEVNVKLHNSLELVPLDAILDSSRKARCINQICCFQLRWVVM